MPANGAMYQDMTREEWLNHISDELRGFLKTRKDQLNSLSDLRPEAIELQKMLILAEFRTLWLDTHIPCDLQMQRDVWDKVRGTY